MGESKYSILSKINPDYLPRTRLFSNSASAKSILKEIERAGINYPFIAKPDIGQGGWMIELIRDEAGMIAFLKRIRIPFIIQEYVDEPLEVGVLYYRFPGSPTGIISSLAVKELLHVTGDGISPLRKLIEQSARASTQLKRLENDRQIDLGAVPAKGVKIPLSVIGNHSYGTVFRNGCHLINTKLVTKFDRLCTQIDGFYFGRFDIRCKRIEDLYKGRFKILELNGVGSEPLHIFDPNEKLLDAYKVAFQHWRIIYEISLANCKNRTSFMKLKEAWTTYRNVLKIQRLHDSRMVIGN